jgi:hypothetical protein
LKLALVKKLIPSLLSWKAATGKPSIPTRTVISSVSLFTLYCAYCGGVNNPYLIDASLYNFVNSTLFAPSEEA